jgi:PAS domain S-box-containing protein
MTPPPAPSAPENGKNKQLPPVSSGGGSNLGKVATDSEMLQLLLDDSPDLIYFKDRNSRFIRGSKALCEHLNIAPEDLPGKSDFDFFASERVRPHFAEEQEIIRTGQPLIGRVEENIGKDGKIWWVLTSKAAFHDQSGNIVGTFGISKNITELKEAEKKLETVHKDLVDASRAAGMAEVAIGVLHNVGNVLNSVNVSAGLIRDNLQRSKLASLAKLAELLRNHESNLPGFLSEDERGRQIVSYLEQLTSHLQQEQAVLGSEVESLVRRIEHIKEIVAAQQNYAHACGVLETVPLKELVEDALKIHGGAYERHGVAVVREFDPLPAVFLDKHKVLQILVNLLHNAKYACDAANLQPKQVTIRLKSAGENRVQIQVADNGIGIPPENLTRVFSQGFTTRKGGHGFGLHSGVLAAREMGGDLTVQSAGADCGATFTLELPVRQQ